MQLRLTLIFSLISMFYTIFLQSNPYGVSFFSLRCKVYHPGVSRYHHLDHRGSSSGSNTFRTEVLWHRLIKRSQRGTQIFKVRWVYFAHFVSLYLLLSLCQKKTPTASISKVPRFNRTDHIYSILLSVFLLRILLLKESQETLSYVMG